MSDLQPDTDDLLQEEQHAAPLTPIPVVVEGPARTVELPVERMVADQVDVDTITPIRILGRDPRRKRCVLMPSGGAVRLAASKKQCIPGSGAIVPTGAMLVLSAYGEIWVMASSGSATTVSYVAEYWAD